MEISTIVLVSFAVTIIGFVAVFGFRKDWIQLAVNETRKSEDITPIVDAISKNERLKHEVTWDQAIGKLWKSYERELAAKLTLKATEHISKTDIAKYWVQQVAEVEPEIARKTFTRKFIFDQLEIKDERPPAPPKKQKKR